MREPGPRPIRSSSYTRPRRTPGRLRRSVTGMRFSFLLHSSFGNAKKLAREDQIRILDLVLIGFVDLPPQARFSVNILGDLRERVALHHRVGLHRVLVLRRQLARPSRHDAGFARPSTAAYRCMAARNDSVVLV